MAGTNYIDTKRMIDPADLDATDPRHVEMFQWHLRAAWSQPAREFVAIAATTAMLITAILADTNSPDRLSYVVDLVLCVTGEVKGSTLAFTTLFEANLAFDQASAIGNLEDVTRCRSEMGYALSACLPLLPRKVLEKITLKFSEWVHSKRMVEVESMIKVVQDQESSPGVVQTPNRTMPTLEKRARYIQEMSVQGLNELLSRLTLFKYHMDGVRKEILTRLGKKVFDKKT